MVASEDCLCHTGLQDPHLCPARRQSGCADRGTFAVFALVGGRGSGGDQIRDVGVRLALGMLMDTVIVRTVLVPCTVILLGRWNWWPSALSRIRQPAPPPVPPTPVP
jgi:hypothetical protein